MASVYVGLGSNAANDQYVRAGLDELTYLFGRLVLSPAYESESVGFEGDNFLNIVVRFQTEMPFANVCLCLRGIERGICATQANGHFSNKLLDIDLLLFDDLVGVFNRVVLPRPEILNHAYVLLPLSQIASNQMHPVEKKSYAQLWRTFDEGSQKLWQVPFSWQAPSLGGLRLGALNKMARDV